MPVAKAKATKQTDLADILGYVQYAMQRYGKRGDSRPRKDLDIRSILITHAIGFSQRANIAEGMRDALGNAHPGTSLK